MTIQCPYCERSYNENETNCPYCGALTGVHPHEAPKPSSDAKRSTVPQTIEELRAFCARHQMPLEKMRFFIGEDYRGARAFGIYRDRDGSFVVYKNKADGSRAIRYQGPDEAFAVREIYEKLREETLRRKNGDAPSRAVAPARRSSGFSLSKIFYIIAIVLFGVNLLRAAIDNRPNRGYYRYLGDYYYYQSGDWYCYDDDISDWLLYPAVDSLLEDNYAEYYESGSYDDSYPVSDFSDTDYYRSSSSSDYDDDDDDDWDYDWDDWDDDDTDWDDDW